VGITEKVAKVTGQRSRSYVYKYVNATAADGEESKLTCSLITAECKRRKEK